MSKGRLFSWLTDFWTRSISRQLILGIALVHAILMSIFVADLVSRERDFLVAQNTALAIGLAETLAINGSSWLVTEDLIGLEEVVNSQKEFPNLNYAMFVNKNFKVLGYTEPNRIGLYLSDDVSKKLIGASNKVHILVDNSTNIDIAAPVFSNNSLIGWARINVSRSAINENLAVVTNHGVLYSIAAILIGVIFAWIMAKGLTSAIRHLVDVSKSVERGKRDVSFQLDRVDELGILSDSLNSTIGVLSKQEAELKEYHQHLEQLVENRTHELHKANIKITANTERISNDKVSLEKAYTELVEFKDKLVEQEKFSQLGKLIADMAHELNTPLGIAITSGSVISDATKNLINSINSKGLKKKELLDTLSDICTAQSLAEKNLARCNDLINSFKKISADQLIEQIKNIDVKEYLQDLFFSLNVLLQKKDVKWNITGAHCSLIIAPGHFTQIFNHLITNSILHAFNNNNDNVITVNVETLENNITIRYQDNGLGMSKSTLDQLFDPFFTTKRNEGNIGLGMSIVYNIVTQNLKGEIHAESDTNNGTIFVITLPLTLNDAMS